VSKGTNPEVDAVPTVNHDHGSAAHAGFDGEVLEKNDIELDTAHISATDHQSAILACSGGEIWKDKDLVLDGVSPLTVHKESGRPTGSDREGLTGREDSCLDSAWTTDNASPKPSGCPTHPSGPGHIRRNSRIRGTSRRHLPYISASTKPAMVIPIGEC
jgi:hypothetical protein